MTAQFWRQHPALLYAVAGLLGCFAAFYSLWCSILFIPLLWDFPKNISKPYVFRLCLAFMIFLSFLSFASSTYDLPSIPPEGVHGTAYVQIKFLSQTTTHYGKQWVYQGKLRTFFPDHKDETDLKGAYIPFRLTLKNHAHLQRPSANSDYILKGVLKSSPAGFYYFSADKDQPWERVDNSWSLAEWQYQTKDSISRYIKSHISSPTAAAFLAGVATGNFDDRRMQFEFGRFGLQHIMAISGFHFAIIASLIGCLLRLFMPQQLASTALIVIISTYFVILGPSPSVIRAWLTILIALFGYLLHKRGTALNSLGVALLLALLYDPLLCQHMGFQLSFLATAAILMLFNGIDKGLNRIFFKRSLSEVIQMNRLNQHGYLLLIFLRQGLALSLAVNLATLPLLLYYFHKFSLMSMLYNLFFPFLVSLSMILLILGLTASLIATPLAQLIHHLNDYYTSFVLNYIYNMPRTADNFLTVESMPLYIVIVSLWAVFYLGVWMHNRAEQQREIQLNFAYL